MKWIESLSGVATRPRRRVAASLRGALVFLLVAALAPGASASTARATGVGRAQTAGTKVDLVISNFQFCHQAPCAWPTEAAYARGLSGPLEGTDNPSKFVAVAPGDTVTWTYEDTASGGPGSCDFYGTPPVPDDEKVACIGHAVTLENGTPQGTTLGFLAARSGRVTLTWVVPAEAKSGSVIRYFCSVRDQTVVPGGNPHWVYGMTGGLKVVAAGALIGAGLGVIRERRD